MYKNSPILNGIRLKYSNLTAAVDGMLVILSDVIISHFYTLECQGKQVKLLGVHCLFIVALMCFSSSVVTSCIATIDK